MREALDTIFEQAGLSELTDAMFESYFDDIDTDRNGTVSILEYAVVVRHACEVGLVLSAEISSSRSSSSSNSSSSGSGKRGGKSSMVRGSDADRLLANPVRLKVVVKKEFKKRDKNKSGTLSQKDIKKVTKSVCSSLGIDNLTKDEFDDVWDMVDADNNGTLDIDEFKTLFVLLLEAAADADHSQSSSSASASDASYDSDSSS